MSFPTRDELFDGLSVFDQPSNDSFWCATPKGRLAHFNGACTETQRLKASLEGYIELIPDRLLTARRPLEFNVCSLKVSPSENLALVAGYLGARLYLTVASLPQRDRARGQVETYNHVCCEGDFIFNRLGMKLHQLAWWPGDDPHFFVVLSGNCLAVYDAHALSVPHATYRLQFGKFRDSAIVSGCGSATGFCFLDNTGDWSAFAICILCDDGAVFVLCPVTVPGISFDKTHVQNLTLMEETEDIVKDWHHAVFSRTQLNQSSEANGNSSEQDTIQTRKPPLNWKRAPALQGPINATRDATVKQFQAIVSMGNGILATASASGRVRFGKIAQVVPAFHMKESRPGAPHVLVLQDCPQKDTTISMTDMSEVCTPPHESKKVQLVKNAFQSQILSATDSYLMLVDCKKVETPLFDVFENEELTLRCVMMGIGAVSVHVEDELRLKCKLLRHQQIENFQSLVKSVHEEDVENTEEDRMDSEETAVEKISDLRDDLKVTYDAITAMCINQEHMSQQASTNLTALQEKIRLMLSDSAISLGQRGHDALVEQYRKTLHEICVKVKEMDPSKSSSFSQAEWIEEAMRQLGMND